MRSSHSIKDPKETRLIAACGMWDSGLDSETGKGNLVRLNPYANLAILSIELQLSC